MNKVQRVSSLRASVSAARKSKKTVGFVATMGNLHAGHIELVKVAKQKTDFVVVSIYVNPTQFAADEDFGEYPATPEEDARFLAEAGADLLFLPTQETMYPGEIEGQTVVYVPKLGGIHCGKDRPKHFYGVSSVVSRLFNMVQPDVAVFGKKDYQQLAIVRRLVTDLAYPIEILGVETVRTETGLALSSRNGYLNKRQLLKAPMLQQVLQEMATALELGTTTINKLEKTATEKLTEAGFDPQYISVCRQSDLMHAKKADQELVILAAAVLGKARLIDNIEVELDPDRMD